MATGLSAWEVGSSSSLTHLTSMAAYISLAYWQGRESTIRMPKMRAGCNSFSPVDYIGVLRRNLPIPGLPRKLRYGGGW
jgi:hypothetical protein